MPLFGLVTAGVLGAVGSIGGAAIGASGAQSAAQTQAQAATYAAGLQATAQQNALNFQKQIWATQQNNQAPFLAAGTGAVGQLSSMMAPGGPLTQGWTGQFQAPTAAQAAATPGYQFQLQQGQQALQANAAARGNLLTGGTLKALDQYSQDLASTNYQQVYNNAFQNYQQNYGQFLTNQTNQYNRLSNMAGMGQIATNQLGTQGSQAATGMANTLLGGAAAQSQALQNAAAATASGYIGQANAYGGAASNLGQMGSNIASQMAAWNAYNAANSPSNAVGSLSDYSAPSYTSSALIPGTVAQPVAPAQIGPVY